jgi:hypothetical protein
MKDLKPGTAVTVGSLALHLLRAADVPFGGGRL